MKVEVVNAPPQYPVQSREINGVTIWCIGFLHGEQQDFCAVLYTALISEGMVNNQEELSNCLRDLHGNFACIVRNREGHVIAATDRIRSYPMYYTQSGEMIYVGSDPYAIKARMSKVTRNPEAFLEFKMAGYVTGGETLFHEIRQLQAGEFLVWDGKEPIVKDYYAFYDSVSSEKSGAELIQELHYTTRDVFQRLIDRLNGRPAWVPLSGGLDSPLVLCMLKTLGYDNIRAFSYGGYANCEVATARKIAKVVNVPWFFIPYTRALGRRVFYTKEREAYFHFAHELSAIPMMTDFYALREFFQQGQISNDAVIINGQTGDFISGGHIPTTFHQDEVSKDELLEAIIKKHYSLWTNMNTLEHTSTIKQRILAMLYSVPDTMTLEQAMKYHERWEWRARQAQHVVVGQRVYDFFGLAWELPLWDDGYLTFWARIPFEHKFKQGLYRAYLEQYDFFGVFKRMKFKRYKAPRYLNPIDFAFKIFGNKQDNYRTIFLQYFQKYAYFYAKDSYWQYIKYARYHRNPSSVLVKDVLENEYQEAVL